jgi:heme O synthase-like polyprenyltransferase
VGQSLSMSPRFLIDWEIFIFTLPCKTSGDTSKNVLNMCKNRKIDTDLDMALNMDMELDMDMCKLK